MDPLRTEVAAQLKRRAGQADGDDLTRATFGMLLSSSAAAEILATMSQPTARVAGREDLDGLTTTLSLAFRDDPVWSWAFPGGVGLEPWWRFYVSNALRYPSTWVLDEYAAAAVWIPPGGTELTEDEEARVGSLLAELVGSRAPAVMELLERFEASHPRESPHSYLSLLGTHPDRRGRGLGMALLADNLAELDAQGVPAYLESTNPDNDKRYERLGFVKVGEFSTPDGRHSVSTMWREPVQPCSP